VRLCSITPVEGVLEFRTYEIDHAADSGALKSSGVALPKRIKGKRQRCGTPRCRHFLRVEGEMPSLSAPSLISFQSSLSAMTLSFRDNLSLRQGTKWSAAVSPGANKLWAMTDDDQTQRLYNDGLRARTRALRKAKGYSYKKMALYLGGIEWEAYKKYETRSPMPAYLYERFCDITCGNVTWLVTGKGAMLAEQPEVPRVTAVRR
jgi:hypothetical protein